MAPFNEALAWLQANTSPLGPEIVPIAEAAGRVLAAAVTLPQLPPRPVAAIDGHAVRAAETEGAGDYAPLQIQGAPIAAGMPLPPETDAVLPPTAFGPGPVALDTVARGAFVVPPGHDVPVHASFPAGLQLRPLHLVLLARGAHRTVPVIIRPHVELRIPFPSGLEAMLAMLIAAEGATVSTASADLVLVVTSSAATISDEPHQFSLVGTPHGPRPGLMLPADPLRCLTLFTLLVAPALRRMGGRREPAAIAATLARKVTSPLGQLDAVPIRLEAGRASPLGPADGCSLLAASTANALLLVPENREGYPAGATVEIIPLP